MNEDDQIQPNEKPQELHSYSQLIESAEDVEAQNAAEAAENQEPPKEVIFRHPQQVLTNKEVQILLMKKEEDMNETEKAALALYFVRAKHHGSRPLKQLNTRQNKKKRHKRRMSNQSRKANR